MRVRDLLDPEVTAPRAIERHHLFPKKYLADLGITGTRQTNAIANMAFLDWAENAKISAQSPQSYWPIMTTGIAADRLRRQTYVHALPVGWEQLDYSTFLTKRRALIAQVIRDGFMSLHGRGAARPLTVDELVAAGESQTVEFKSSARHNAHTGEADARLENVIVKTVCGFLNAEGGTVFIGVADDGRPVGIDADLSTLRNKANVDGYELFLRQLLETSLSVSTAGTVRITFETLHGVQVCAMTVAASGKPVFAKPLKGQGGAEASEFWVRTGNQTRQLHGDDMVHYQSEHWG